MRAFGYRWESWWYPYLTKQLLEDGDSWMARELYVCDDTTSWESPHIQGMRLYLIHFDIKNPLVILNSRKCYEWEFGHKEVDAVRAKGYDAIIYTPHAKVKPSTNRQTLLLYPAQQVLEIELLQGDHHCGLPPGVDVWSWGD